LNATKYHNRYVIFSQTSQDWSGSVRHSMC